MKKLILRAYGVAAILFLFLFLYGLLNLRLSVYRQTPMTGYGEITQYETMSVLDPDTPLGEKTVITFELKNVRSDYNTLLFLTSHQAVNVFLDNEQVYSLKVRDVVLLPKSPGNVYNEVVFKEEDNGKLVRIELIPAYGGLRALPDLMLGNGYQIIKVILFSNFPILLLCGLVVLIGIVQFLITIVALATKHDDDMSVPLLHAVFTVLIGIWKMLDSDFFALFGKAVPVLSIIPFLMLMFLPLILTKFVRDFARMEKTGAWRIPEVTTLIGISICLALQFFGVADFQETLWIELVTIGIAFVCMYISIWSYIRGYKLDHDAKAGLIVTTLAMLWTGIDLYTYFGTAGVTTFPFSMVLFLMFLLFMIGNRMHISKKGMEVGMQARQYKKLAYHDALTGFFNRAAYMDFLTSSDFKPKTSVIVAFDLNNLKKCNDLLGHDKGDIYIKEAAKIIMDCFGERGRCYRLGGDEFGAILIDETEAGCARRVRRMNDRVNRFNLASRDIKMGIASGYAMFDPEEDNDIHATIRRADKMMYEEKFRMKQQQAAEEQMQPMEEQAQLTEPEETTEQKEAQDKKD
ncbi:MAG: diguanylate cyclase [Lachnospiraceae bacterium]|nr:diguanylate cyclase [Lachnospiraceae bacterium]